MSNKYKTMLEVRQMREEDRKITQRVKDLIAKVAPKLDLKARPFILTEVRKKFVRYGESHPVIVKYLKK